MSKEIKWSDARVRDFFQAIMDKFGTYNRRCWLPSRCIETPRGVAVSKYEFDQSIRFIERALCAKWEHDGDPLPTNRGFQTMLERVTSNALVSWVKETHERYKAIAIEVGFITQRDLTWLENVSKTRKK